jgi:photosystem II stability/assembly factor-like uncharacterized protein
VAAASALAAWGHRRTGGGQPRRCLRAQRPGVLARTDDGGQQWTQLLPAAAPAGQLAAVSATTAFGAQDAVDAGAVLRSGNGGRSWDVIAQLPGVITQLDFPSAGDGVAVTFQGAGTWQPWLSRDGA